MKRSRLRLFAACSVVAIVLVAASLFATGHVLRRDRLERAAIALGQANTCLYGGPLEGESRAARLFAIELCEKHVHGRTDWPSACEEPFAELRRTLLESDLHDEAGYRELYALAQPRPDDANWPDAFDKAVEATEIVERPAPARSWCRAPPVFSATAVQPLAHGLVTSIGFERRGAGLGVVFHTLSPEARTHACTLRDTPEGPVGRCRALETQMERPRSVPSEDPTIVAVHDELARRLVVLGDPVRELRDVSDDAWFARDGRLLELFDGVRVTRAGVRSEPVPWPRLKRAGGNRTLFGELVAWFEKDAPTREAELWVQRAGADGNPEGDQLSLGRFSDTLTLAFPGDVASCALDPQRRVFAVVHGSRVRLFVHDGSAIAAWGDLQTAAQDDSRADLSELRCYRGGAVLAWKEGDQRRVARCTARGCESRAARVELGPFRSLNMAGEIVVLVDRGSNAAGAPIVVRAGPVSSADKASPQVLAVDTSRGGPLAPDHRVHVASTSGAVWVLSTPERVEGPLIAFRVDAEGRVAVVRPETLGAAGSR
jgi:hypothetical protein